MSTKIVSFSDINYSYSQNFFLNLKSVTIKQGENILLLGGNGSGKTTLLKLLTNNLYSKDLRIDTQSGQKNKIAWRDFKTSLAWVPSRDNGFFPRLTGLENINFFAAVINAESLEERIKRWSSIETFKKCIDTKYSQYSTGMKQIFQIFCLTMHTPKYIFMDEPFRSLDTETKLELKTLLLSEFKDCSLIISSHLKEEMDFLAAEVISLKDGQLVS